MHRQTRHGLFSASNFPPSNFFSHGFWVIRRRPRPPGNTGLYVIWLLTPPPLSPPPPLPSSTSWSLFLSLRVAFLAYWRGGGEEGRSQIIGQRKRLVLYDAYNTLCVIGCWVCGPSHTRQIKTVSSIHCKKRLLIFLKLNYSRPREFGKWHPV